MNYSVIELNNSLQIYVNANIILDNQEFYKYTKSLKIILELLKNNKLIEKFIILFCILIYPILGLYQIDITMIIQDRQKLKIFNICLIIYGCISLYKLS